MASRLNHLFQTAPRQFLERTVLFADGLTTPESVSQMRNKMAHFIDLEPTGQHLQARARVLAAQHLYQDMPLAAYFVPPEGVALIPRENPPLRFVFMPEFSGCRLLVSSDGTGSLRLQIEQNLFGVIPAPDPAIYADSFAYWDHTGGQLVGVVRATAILVWQPEELWTVYMQQIVGTAGHELVRQTFSRRLKV